MSKILTIIKNILLALLIYLLIKSYISYGIFSVILLFVLIIFILIHLKDLFVKNENDKYNILLIISLLIINFVFIRTLYDPGFLNNSNIVNDYISTYDLSEFSVYGLESSLNTQNLMYLIQNTNFFVILILLLLVYRALNLTKEHKENKKFNLTMLIISIIDMLPSIYLLIYCLFIDKDGYHGDFILIYLLLSLILIGFNLYRFIGGRYKDSIKTFIVTIVLNILSLFVIYLNVHYILTLFR